jgi:hypothetical protein
VYSLGSLSQNNLASSTSSQGVLRGEAKPWLIVPLEAADAAEKAFLDAAIMQAPQDESSNTYKSHDVIRCSQQSWENRLCIPACAAKYTKT